MPTNSRDLSKIVYDLLYGLVQDGDMDPNSNIPSLIRTQHVNCPTSDIPWYIHTIKTGVSKAQIAIAAGGSKNMAAFRAVGDNGQWISNWVYLNNSNLTVNDIPNLPASKITSGTISADRIPTLNQNTTGSAAKLTTGRTIQVNLSNDTAVSFDGTANVSPGVTGTLPISRGGTGSTTSEQARTNLGIKSAALQETSYFATANQGSLGATAHGWGNHASAGYVKTDTTYTNGSGLTLTGNVFSVNLSASHIPSLDASKITSGIIAQARLPRERLFTVSTSDPDNSVGEDGDIWIKI